MTGQTLIPLPVLIPALAAAATLIAGRRPRLQRVITQAALAAVVGVCAALVYLAGYDPLYDEGLAYAEKLKRAGNQVLLCEEPGMTHDFMRMSGLLEEVPVIHGRVASWLDGQLGC